MAWNTPGTATAGSVLTAAFWNAQVRDNMTELAPFSAAWTSFTPQIDQGATTNITKTISYAKYVQVGKLVIGSAYVSITGTGTAGSIVTVTVPKTAVASQGVIGNAWVFDSSTSTAYGGQASMSSTTAISIVGDWSAGNAWGQSPSIALASADQIRMTFIYEAA